MTGVELHGSGSCAKIRLQNFETSKLKISFSRSKNRLKLEIFLIMLFNYAKKLTVI